jgi:dTDP-4-amino-4,6-dideoxygalactose transaminase
VFTEEASARCISLPIWSEMTFGDVRKVCETIAQIYARADGSEGRVRSAAGS